MGLQPALTPPAVAVAAATAGRDGASGVMLERICDAGAPVPPSSMPRILDLSDSGGLFAAWERAVSTRAVSEAAVSALGSPTLRREARGTSMRLNCPGPASESGSGGRARCLHLPLQPGTVPHPPLCSLQQGGSGSHMHLASFSRRGGRLHAHPTRPARQVRHSLS